MALQPGTRSTWSGCGGGVLLTRPCVVVVTRARRAHGGGGRVAAAASELAGALGGAASRSLAGDRTRRRIRSAALAPPQRCNHVCSARKASSSGTCAVGLPPARTACVGGDTGMGIVEGRDGTRNQTLGSAIEPDCNQAKRGFAVPLHRSRALRLSVRAVKERSLGASAPGCAISSTVRLGFEPATRHSHAP
jgi:hypothetical protein